MGKLINRLFRDWGTAAWVVSGQTQIPVRVFLQSKGLQKLSCSFIPLGQLPNGAFICYLPAGAPVRAGDSLLYRQQTYQILRAEPMVGLRGEIYCHRALCSLREVMG